MLFASLRVLCLTATIMAICGLSGQSTARAIDGPRAQRSWVLRSDAFLLSGAGLFGPTAASVGLSFQKTFFERWAWEETIGWGVGNRNVDGKDIGFTLAGTLRFAALMNHLRTSALTVGLGSAFILGGGYGHLHFAFAELGYEYRGRDGLSLVVAAGPNLLYAAPDKRTCEGAWVCSEFRRGDFAPLGHVRAGLGWAF